MEAYQDVRTPTDDTHARRPKKFVEEFNKKNPRP
jgi:hypothetical protein